MIVEKKKKHTMLYRCCLLKVRSVLPHFSFLFCHKFTFFSFSFTFCLWSLDFTFFLLKANVLH